MWIAIIGASSTGKEFVAKLLNQKEYSKIDVDFPIKRESDYLTKHLLEQVKAQSVMFEKNIYTYRTIWDSFEVMSKCALESMMIGQEDYNEAELLYNKINSLESLQPPNLVIYTRMEKKDIQNRILLQGRSVDDMNISLQIGAYEEFISKIRVPKLEIDMSQKPELISEEILFGIDSVLSMVLTQKTIWKRSMFYGGV